tara:strand:+ start:97 stop:978 length:882 start_codon:yes stop_codon:yes gene_type:complete
MSAVDDNDSGVSEDINLNDIDTESKFNKITKQADKAERDLERAEKARIKTEAEVQKSAELLKNLEEKQIQAKTASPLWNMGGNDNIHGEGDILGIGKQHSGLPYGTTTITDKSSRSPFGQEEMNQHDFLDLIHQQQQAMRKNQKEIMELKQQVKFFQKEITLDMGKMNSMMHNPKGNIMNFITGRGGIGRIATMGGIYGVIAYAVYEVGKAVFDTVSSMVIEQFRDGGIFDVRKMVKDEVTVIQNFRHMQEVEQGLVFFTSDTAETLRQGSPQNANTRQLEYGHKQFNQLFNN